MALRKLDALRAASCEQFGVSSASSRWEQLCGSGQYGEDLIDHSRRKGPGLEPQAISCLQPVQHSAALRQQICGCG